jgi:uncharacterized membrane protein
MSNRRLASRVINAVALLVPVVKAILFVAPARPGAAIAAPGPVIAVWASSTVTVSWPGIMTGRVYSARPAAW